MTIIEIKKTQYGEVAYLYDQANGRVVKVWVDDRTKRKTAEPEDIEEATDDYEVEPPPLRRRTKITRKQPIVEVEEPLDEPDGTEDSAPPKITKIRPTMIPREIAGIFKPAGQPGAAMEVRNT